MDVQNQDNSGLFSINKECALKLDNLTLDDAPLPEKRLNYLNNE